MTRDCREIRERFDELLDELLPEDERRSIEEHLGGCDACSRELAELEMLLAAARDLPREIQPARNLWSGIEPRLIPRRRPLADRLAALLPDWSELFSPQVLAAVAAAFAVVALAGLLWRNQPAAPSAGPVTAVSAAETPDAIARSAQLARSEDGVMLARLNLIEAVEGPKEHLSPETVAVIEDNMRIIDQAIGQIRSALEEDPLNHQLNMLLAAQYQREAELLKQVSGV